MSKTSRTADIPRTPAGLRARIRYELDLRGETFSSIARRLGVSDTAVRHAACGQPSERIEKALAEAVGIDHRILFDLHYDATGKRMPTRGGVRNRTHDGQGTRVSKRRNGEKSEAA